MLLQRSIPVVNLTATGSGPCFDPIHTMAQASDNDLSYIRIREGRMSLNGSPLAAAADAGTMYRELGCSYPKFFKMDNLSKWAWLGAEVLLRRGEGWAYDGTDKARLGLALSTQDGCLEADKRYAESMSAIASPALFVYTLPNIMLGEICIRHGFKGEQLCTVADAFDPEEMLYQAQDLLEKRNLSHCLVGWADANAEHQDVCLFWIPAAAANELTAAWFEAGYQSN